MNALIIDDEPHCITALQNDLEMFCPEVHVADTCHSGKEALLSIKKNKPELIFLDVEMPWMNGFEMLEILDGDIDFQVIFTTAYSQFAAQAFRVSAVDYLLKPIDSDDLISAVGKAQKALADKNASPHLNNLLQNAKAPAEQQRIAVPNREGYEFIAVSEIIYCKAEGAYSSIVLSNKSLLLSKSLGEVESMLPVELFERIHHSILVNVQHINQLKKSSGSFIVMNNGDELSVAKSKKNHLLVRLGIK